jgi:hypothetical protein
MKEMTLRAQTILDLLEKGKVLRGFKGPFYSELKGAVIIEMDILKLPLDRLADQLGTRQTQVSNGIRNPAIKLWEDFLIAKMALDHYEVSLR